MTGPRDRGSVATHEPAGVLARVEALLGAEAADLEEGTPVALPGSDRETADLLRVAGEEGWTVLPRGAGLGPGVRDGDGPRPDLVVSTLAMDRLVEYEPGDLVVRGRAGLTLSRLQESVGRERQWLALDPPGGEAITLGGLVASGAAGPLRIRYGRPRDQLLGLTLVDGGGRILSLGGRVVKNVAGFDLVRLAAGSRGALGIVTEATFRLYPRPEEDRTLVWNRAEAGDAWDLGRELALLPLPLTAAELLGGAWGPRLDGDASAETFRIMVRLGGSTPEVDAMRGVLTEVAGPPARELEGETSYAAARALAEADGSEPISFRAHALPGRGRPLAVGFAALPVRRFALHLLHGTFRGTLDVERDPEALLPLARDVRAAEGVLRLLRSPGRSGAEIEVGVEASPALRSLESRIVDEFDPEGILPGRWGGRWS